VSAANTGDQGMINAVSSRGRSNKGTVFRSAAASDNSLQRKCACGGAAGLTGECDACHASKLYPARAPGGPVAAEAPAIVSDVLRSNGQPLHAATRVFMETRFGHDFGRVRIHIDAAAARSARMVNARAYTVGRDVVFDEGFYRPESPAGRALLAHELAHVVQQRGGVEARDAARTIPISNSGESEADGMAESAMEGTAPPSGGAQPMALARQASEAGNVPNCLPAAGKAPSAGNCSAYSANAWWLPPAYVVNATCACLATPDSPTSNCVRQFLQDRLAGYPVWLQAAAAGALASSTVPGGDAAYNLFVQTMLTPRIYQDHVDAYAACCCPSGPAAYPAWIGVTTVPIPVCDLVGLTIRYLGSCHGTPGAW
jgi:Domain of unknown function (DUF4157)